MTTDAPEKFCSGCGEVKPITEFYKSPKESLGVRNTCKACSKAYTVEWRAENPGRNAAAKKERYKKDPEKHREAGRRYYENNKDKIKVRNKRFQAENRASYLETARNSAEKRRATARVKLSENVSRALRHRLINGKGGRKTFDILGYTVDELKVHLENQFETGMSWDNYGEWEIDHIIPVSAHNYETPEDVDFQRCWALTNLRPLWKSENRSKGAKLAAPFQPTLMLRHANDNSPPKSEDKPAKS